MTLTVVHGCSGSGKSTFLEAIFSNAQYSTYIKQYHQLRPTIAVSSIPDFDPQELPYWEVYQKENVDKIIKVGGTLAGRTTLGLSGGQRKLLILELLSQRLSLQKSNQLILMDEPFAGVTDEFVPYLTSRIVSLSAKHNFVLVTNDHVHTLTDIAVHSLERFITDLKCDTQHLVGIGSSPVGKYYW